MTEPLRSETRVSPISSEHDNRPPGYADGGIAAANLRIREMNRSDLAQVGGILFRSFHTGAVKHGYAPRIQSAQEGQAWAWSILRHGPHEVLVAECDDGIAGVCCLHPRGANGGIGPVAVDPARQGRGIGNLLVSAVLDRSGGLESVRLFQEAFNPSSFLLYYGLGFLPVTELLDMAAEPGVRKETSRCCDVNELTARELAEAGDYDMPRSRYDRGVDLAYYVKWGKVLVLRRGSEIRGLLSCVPGAGAVHLGPLVAEGEEDARVLYEHALAVYGDRRLGTRVMARDRLLVGALRGLGFTVYCLNMLMVRGAWRPGPYVEAFGRFPEGT